MGYKEEQVCVNVCVSEKERVEGHKGVNIYNKKSCCVCMRLIIRLWRVGKQQL